MAARKTIVIEPDVADVLRRSTFSADLLTLPPEQLERNLYERVAKVLKAYGGKWNKKRNGLEFLADDKALIEHALATGVAVRQQVVKQAYYTPQAAADQLVHSVGLSLIHGAKHVLEPSVGTGNLIAAALRFSPQPMWETLSVFETDQRALSRFEDKVADGSTLSLHSSTRVFYYPHSFTLGTGVFRKQYNLILANPPYTEGAAEQHISTMLALCLNHENGILGAIVPRGFTERNATMFGAMQKDWDNATLSVHATSLPDDAFKESETSAKTEILIVRSYGKLIVRSYGK